MSTIKENQAIKIPTPFSGIDWTWIGCEADTKETTVCARLFIFFSLYSLLKKVISGWYCILKQIEEQLGGITTISYNRYIKSVRCKCNLQNFFQAKTIEKLFRFQPVSCLNDKNSWLKIAAPLAWLPSSPHYYRLLLKSQATLFLETLLSLKVIKTSYCLFYIFNFFFKSRPFLGVKTYSFRYQGRVWIF